MIQNDIKCLKHKHIFYQLQEPTERMKHNKKTGFLNTFGMTIMQAYWSCIFGVYILLFI